MKASICLEVLFSLPISLQRRLKLQMNIPGAVLRAMRICGWKNISMVSSTIEDLTPNAQDLQKWLSTLSQAERDTMLSEILESSLKGDQTAAIQQIYRFNKARQTSKGSKKEKFKTRTVGQLLKESEKVRKARVQLEAEKVAAELAERQRLQRTAREKRLNENPSSNTHARSSDEKILKGKMGDELRFSPGEGFEKKRAGDENKFFPRSADRDVESAVVFQKGAVEALSIGHRSREKHEIEFLTLHAFYRVDFWMSDGKGKSFFQSLKDCVILKPMGGNNADLINGKKVV
jgi:ribonuclease HI